MYAFYCNLLQQVFKKKLFKIYKISLFYYFVQLYNYDFIFIYALLRKPGLGILAIGCFQIPILPL